MAILFQDDFESRVVDEAVPGWTAFSWIICRNAPSLVVSGSKSIHGAGQPDGVESSYTGIAARSQVEYSITQRAVLKPDTTILLQEQWHADNPSGSAVPTAGYRAVFSGTSASITVTLYTKTSSGAWVYAADQSRAWSVAAGDVVVTKLRVDGQNVKVKVWNQTAESEPAYVLDYTDPGSAKPDGVFYIKYNNGGGYAATGFDDFVIYDLEAADTTAPTLTSPTATATGATTASGSVSTTEATGTLYYLVSANASESATTVKAGSSQTVSATGVQNVSVTGLTAESPYYLHFVHRDAAGNDSAVSTSAQFTTSAAGDTTLPTLTGSVTFASVTQTTYTAQWTAGADNVAVTGYEYQIGGTGGAWTDAGNTLSAAITGRTAGTTETVYVRAYDAAGNRSTPAISGDVTLDSTPAAGINVTEPLKNNTGTVLASQSGVRVAVLQAADLVSVFEATGLTTNALGVLGTISDAAIVAGQQYHVAIKLADGGVGITGPITAS